MALASETDLDRLLDLIAARLRELLGARLVTVLLPAGPDDLRFAAAAGEGADELVGATTPRAASKSGIVLEQRRSERVDSVLDDPEVDQRVARSLAARTGIWVPLIARERAIGVIVAHDKLGSPDAVFSDDDLRLAEAFAARAAVAVDLSERVERDTMRRTVAAQEVERRRLARELHDETGQALTSILLGLKALEEKIEHGDWRPAVATLRESVVTTLQDVRRLAVELRPKALDDFGLVPRSSGSARRFPSRPASASTSRRHSVRSASRARSRRPSIGSCRRRSRTSVKHAHARHVSILLTRKDGAVATVIEDDGRGFDPARADADRFGIEGMRERVKLLNGRLEIESAEGRGTTIVVEVPAH